MLKDTECLLKKIFGLISLLNAGSDFRQECFVNLMIVIIIEDGTDKMSDQKSSKFS